MFASRTHPRDILDVTLECFRAFVLWQSHTSRRKTFQNELSQNPSKAANAVGKNQSYPGHQSTTPHEGPRRPRGSQSTTNDRKRKPIKERGCGLGCVHEMLNVQSICACRCFFFLEGRGGESTKTRPNTQKPIETRRKLCRTKNGLRSNHFFVSDGDWFVF